MTADVSGHPSRIGRFEVLRVLGRGGMATVYEVRDPDRGAPSALKVLPRELAARPDFDAAFRQEFSLLTRLVHPGLARIADFGQLEDGSPWFTMELLRGRSLADGQACDPPALPLLAHRLAEVLAYVHGRGIVHGDIKPANVVLDTEARPRLVDFGLSRALHALHPVPPRGTLEFVAPEVLAGTSPEPRSDLYALGILLFELVAGGPFFRSDEAGIRALKHDPRAHDAETRERLADVPTTWREILAALLAAQPSERFRSARLLLRRIEETFSLPASRPVLLREHVRAEGPEPGSFAATEFVGRERELATLTRALADLEKAKGNAFLLVGEEGIGKSRLLHELRLRAALEGHTVVDATDADPLAALVEATGCGEHVIAADGFLHALTARPPARSPVLLVDDLERRDIGALELITRLAEGARQLAPLLVVGALRTGAGSHPGRTASMETIELRGLAGPEFAELAAALAHPHAPAPALVESLRAASGGNPLLAIELLREHLAAGDFDRPLAASATRSAGEIIGRNLARLPEPTRAALAAASIWGRRFRGVRARRLLDLDAEAFAIRLLPALEAGVIRPAEASDAADESGDDALVFAHGAARQVLYGTIEENERRAHHARAADILAEELGREPETAAPERRASLHALLAHHAWLGERAEEAVEHRLRSARLFTEAWRNRDALEAYREVVLWTREPRESGAPAAFSPGKVLADKAGVEALIGLPREAHESLDAALARARQTGDSALVARVLHQLGDLAFVEGRIEEATSVLAEARAAAQAAGDEERRMRVLRSLGNAALSRAEYKEAEDAYRLSLEIAERLGDRELAAGNRSNLGIVLARLGRSAEAETLYRRAIEEAETLGLAEQTRRTLVSLGVLLVKTDRLPEALPFFERSLRMARDIGYRRGEAVVRYNLTEVYARMGTLEKSLAEHERALAVAREIGDRTAEGMNLAHRASVLVELGRLGSAASDAREALRLLEEAGESRARSRAWGALADAHLLLGEDEKARDAARRALALAREGGDPEEETYALLGRARILRRTSASPAELEEAGTLLERAAMHARAIGSARLEFLADEETSRLHSARGRHADALAASETLVADAEGLDNRVLRARAALARAASLMSAAAEGELVQAGEAASSARRALDLARELEAPFLRVEGHALVARGHQLEGRYADAAKEAARAVEILRVVAEAVPEGSERAGFWTAALPHLRRAHRLQRRSAGLPAPPEKTLEGMTAAELLRALDEGEAPHPDHAPVPPPDDRPRPAAAERAPVPPAASRAGNLATLNEVGRIIHSIPDLEELLPRILDLALQSTDAGRGLVILADPTTGTLEVKARANVEEETVASATQISESILRDVLQGGSPIMSADAQSDPRYRNRQSVMDLGITSLLCVPLRTPNATLGTVYVDRTGAPRPFQREDLEFLCTFADLAAIAIENAHMHRQLTEENAWLRGEVEGRYRFSELVGESAPWRRVVNLVAKVADNVSTVLIEGESGTGKEMVARAIHFNGPRHDQRFVAVDCGAIPSDLLESELFGHARGAYTGAVAEKKGLFEDANGGTLFLDEVTNIPLALQAKLLRVLQEREVRRLGETRTRPVDVRIISASNRSVREEVSAGRFREDLFYRLHVIPLRLPPLRERAGDVALLAHRWLQVLHRDRDMPLRRLSPPALDRLVRYPWPGNVRELENVLERALVLSAGPEIRLEDLPPEIHENEAPAAPDTMLLRENERRLIRLALEKTEGEIKGAARLLGISRTTLYSKMDKHGLRGLATS